MFVLKRVSSLGGSLGEVGDLRFPWGAVVFLLTADVLVLKGWRCGGRYVGLGRGLCRGEQTCLDGLVLWALCDVMQVAVSVEFGIPFVSCVSVHVIAMIIIQQTMDDSADLTGKPPM